MAIPSYRASTLYDAGDYIYAFSIDGSIMYPVMGHPEYTFYQEGTTHDAQVYYQNDSGIILKHVTIEPVALTAEAAARVNWWKFAATEAGLDAAIWGHKYTIGELISPGERANFWVRCTSPAQTSDVQLSYTDVVLRITGYYLRSTVTFDAHIAVRKTATFTIDAILS